MRDGPASTLGNKSHSITRNDESTVVPLPATMSHTGASSVAS